MTRLLAEDLVLLRWDDRKGAVHARCSAGLAPGIAGASLLDAIAAGALEVRDNRVHVTGTAADDPLVADLVEAAGRASRPRKVRHFVSSQGNRKRTTAVLERLVDELVVPSEVPDAVAKAIAAAQAAVLAAISAGGAAAAAASS